MCILYCYPGPRAGLWNNTHTAAADIHASAHACSNASTIASDNVSTLSMLMYVPIFLAVQNSSLGDLVTHSLSD